jgi:MFS family permease
MASTHQPGFLPGQDPGQTGSARWVLTATILASSMAFIDSTALDIALPALQADLDASGKQLLWIVNAYLLLLSSLILAGGSLGDRFGRKRIFRLGILTFTAGSLAAGLAPTADWLIAFRAVQGAGGALMVPGSLALLSATVADHEQGRAIGTRPDCGGSYSSSIFRWRPDHLRSCSATFQRAVTRRPADWIWRACCWSPWPSAA